MIISNVVANEGCPCPGILDARLAMSDTYLHFFYNVAVYEAVVVAFCYLVNFKRHASLSAEETR